MAGEDSVVVDSTVVAEAVHPPVVKQLEVQIVVRLEEMPVSRTVQASLQELTGSVAEQVEEESSVEVERSVVVVRSSVLVDE